MEGLRAAPGQRGCQNNKSKAAMETGGRTSKKRRISCSRWLGSSLISVKSLNSG